MATLQKLAEECAERPGQASTGVCLLNVPLLFIGLAPLVAFNVDVARTWVTPEGGGPHVLRSLLHQDPSSKQTW